MQSRKPRNFKRSLPARSEQRRSTLRLGSEPFRPSYRSGRKGCWCRIAGPWLILRVPAQDLREHRRIVKHRLNWRGGNCHTCTKIFVLELLCNSSPSDNGHNETRSACFRLALPSAGGGNRRAPNGLPECNRWQASTGEWCRPLACPHNRVARAQKSQRPKQVMQRRAKLRAGLTW